MQNFYDNAQVHHKEDLYDLEIKTVDSSINSQKVKLAESVICPTTWCK